MLIASGPSGDDSWHYLCCFVGRPVVAARKIMKYSVNIPLGEGVNFPNTCPFSGESSPGGTVRLKQTKTLMLIPLPGFIYNRYSVTTFHVPASKKIANLAKMLEFMVWASLLGGIAICFLLLTNTHGGKY